MNQMVVNVMKDNSLKFYSALNISEEKTKNESLVLLHGWGSDSRCWSPMLESLRNIADVYTLEIGDANQFLALDDDSLIIELLSALPHKFTLLGWSLGGMLATQIASRYPHRVAHLITLATNLKFVANDAWPMAMSRQIFNDFVVSFSLYPEVTLRRFCGLMAKGDYAEKTLLRQLKGLTAIAFDQGCAEVWLSNLKLLGELDNRQLFSRLSVPGLHLLAANDNLIPQAVSASITNLNSKQEVLIVDDFSHAFLYSHGDKITTVIHQFLKSEIYKKNHDQYEINKLKIAESFGRSANKYDSVANVQRQVANTLIAKLTDVSTSICLDLGCGTGYSIPALAEQFEHIVGLDIAEGMLSYSKARHCANWVCADAEKIPLANASVDVVFSSLAIQWCENLPALFASLRRVVKPGGKILIATLGPQTLHELRSAWGCVDEYVHVNKFVSQDELLKAVHTQSFSKVTLDKHKVILSYDELRQLTYELKTLGAHNMNSGQGTGLTGPKKIKKLKQSYEVFRDKAGFLPATYEVFYLELVC
jgi:malonyl-CoA O-methyltransferase